MLAQAEQKRAAAHAKLEARASTELASLDHVAVTEGKGLPFQPEEDSPGRRGPADSDSASGAGGGAARLTFPLLAVRLMAEGLWGLWVCRGRRPSGGPRAWGMRSARPDTPTKLSSRNARRVRIQASVCKARITRRSMSTATAGPCAAGRCVRRAWTRVLFIILLLWRRR